MVPVGSRLSCRTYRLYRPDSFLFVVLWFESHVSFSLQARTCSCSSHLSVSCHGAWTSFFAGRGKGRCDCVWLRPILCDTRPISSGQRWRVASRTSTGNAGRECERGGSLSLGRLSAISSRARVFAIFLGFDFGVHPCLRAPETSRHHVLRTNLPGRPRPKRRER